MKDSKKRDKGKYTETFEKEVDGVTYTKVETTIVGRDFVIMQMSNDYNPGLEYPKTWESM